MDEATSAAEELQFGDAVETPTPSLESEQKDVVLPPGSGTRTVEESAGELQFGDAEGTPTPSTRQYEWHKFFKYYQLVILLILIGTLFLLILVDISHPPAGNEDSYLDTLLPVLMPIFTFLLGMSTKSRDE